MCISNLSVLRQKLGIKFVDLELGFMICLSFHIRLDRFLCLQTEAILGIEYVNLERGYRICEFDII